MRLAEPPLEEEAERGRCLIARRARQRLILPSITRIAPKLTPLAAALVMTLAVGTHILYADFAGVVPSLVPGSLSAFVAWGRYRAAPIAPRAQSSAETAAVSEALRH